jgi:hypothetical protein
MANHIYYVVFHQGEWKVKYAGQHYGPYTTQALAIADAVDSAQRVGKQGHTAQVLVQRKDDNTFRTEWTYGKDPYPPRG